MEPQNINQNSTTSVETQRAQQESPKPQVEEPPVIVDWKKPIISMIIVGVLALGLMMLVKNL